MRVGQNIKRARKAAKLTQQQLADRVHITTRSLQWYESGDRQPPSAVLYNIAEATGQSMDWFYSDDPLSERSTA